MLESLAELEAAARWRDQNVTGFGGRGGGLSSDLLDAAIARLSAAGKRADDALAALTAKQGVADRRVSEPTLARRPASEVAA